MRAFPNISTENESQCLDKFGLVVGSKRRHTTAHKYDTGKLEAGDSAPTVDGNSMRLMHLGKARLAIALPRHRKQLRETFDLFETYALASTKHDNLPREAG